MGFAQGFSSGINPLMQILVAQALRGDAQPVQREAQSPLLGLLGSAAVAKLAPIVGLAGLAQANSELTSAGALSPETQKMFADAMAQVRKQESRALGVRETQAQAAQDAARAKAGASLGALAPRAGAEALARTLGVGGTLAGSQGAQLQKALGDQLARERQLAGAGQGLQGRLADQVGGGQTVQPLGLLDLGPPESRTNLLFGAGAGEVARAGVPGAPAGDSLKALVNAVGEAKGQVAAAGGEAVRKQRRAEVTKALQVKGLEAVVGLAAAGRPKESKRLLDLIQDEREFKKALAAAKAKASRKEALSFEEQFALRLAGGISGLVRSGKEIRSQAHAAAVGGGGGGGGGDARKALDKAAAKLGLTPEELINAFIPGGAAR